MNTGNNAHFQLHDHSTLYVERPEHSVREPVVVLDSSMPVMIPTVQPESVILDEVVSQPEDEDTTR